MTTLRSITTIIVMTLFMMELLLSSAHARTQYQFKQYTYRRKRDDNKFRSVKQQCELSSECNGFWGLEYTKCVMMCISETCYKELYGDDPLEDGEVDVRLNSFKGCLSQVV
ncbi:hypothetical protein ACOMHN_038215 [Nucella lapillus]